MNIDYLLVDSIMNVVVDTMRKNKAVEGLDKPYVNNYNTGIEQDISIILDNVRKYCKDQGIVLQDWKTPEGRLI
jgi:hypothetical protein